MNRPLKELSGVDWYSKDRVLHIAWFFDDGNRVMASNLPPTIFVSGHVLLDCFGTPDAYEAYRGPFLMGNRVENMREVTLYYPRKGLRLRLFGNADVAKTLAELPLNEATRTVPGSLQSVYESWIGYSTTVTVLNSLTSVWPGVSSIDYKGFEPDRQ